MANGTPTTDFKAVSGTGNVADFAMMRMSELAVNIGLPLGADVDRKGWCFTASQAAAGVAPGTSATTTTPNFTIWYPTGGSVRVYLVDAVYVYVSGTIGAGHIYYGETASTAAPTGGTAISSFCTDGTTAVPGSIVCGTGHTTTAMGAGSDRASVVDLAATLATAPAAGIGSPTNIIYGRIGRWLPPGIAGCMFGVTAAGSSPLLRATLRFIAYPISSLT